MLLRTMKDLTTDYDLTYCSPSFTNNNMHYLWKIYCKIKLFDKFLGLPFGICIKKFLYSTHTEIIILF